MARRTAEEKEFEKRILKEGLYSNAWFPRDVEPLWNEKLRPLFGRRIDSYLEIGVCEGASMLWVIEHLKPKHVVGVDPYIPNREKNRPQFEKYEENFRRNLAEHLESERVTLYKEKSRDWLLDQQYLRVTPAQRRQEHGKFDFIYIDGDHGATESMWDMVLSWPLLKEKGIMLLDDYSRRWHHGRPWCHEAIDAFLMAYEKKYWEMWRTDKQICIKKYKDG